jgi:hypothetical protein
MSDRRIERLADIAPLDVLRSELAALGARIDRLSGVVFAIHERLATVELRVGLPATREASPGIGVKRASAISGYSESMLRKMARAGKTPSVWIGGRLFLREDGLPARRSR